MSIKVYHFKTPYIQKQNFVISQIRIQFERNCNVNETKPGHFSQMSYDTNMC